MDQCVWFQISYESYRVCIFNFVLNFFYSDTFFEIHYVAAWINSNLFLMQHSILLHVIVVFQSLKVMSDSKVWKPYNLCVYSICWWILQIILLGGYKFHLPRDWRCQICFHEFVVHLSLGNCLNLLSIKKKLDHIFLWNILYSLRVWASKILSKHHILNTSSLWDTWCTKSKYFLHLWLVFSLNSEGRNQKCQI